LGEEEKQEEGCKEYGAGVFEEKMRGGHGGLQNCGWEKYKFS
jgi:hypothetical protein